MDNEPLSSLLFSNDYRDRFTPEKHGLEAEAVKEHVVHMVNDIWETLDLNEDKERQIGDRLDQIMKYLGGCTYGSRLVAYRNFLTKPDEESFYEDGTPMEKANA